jgi:alcohol dehydrogenase
MRFYLPTRIIFERGAITQAPDIIRDDFHAQKVFVITDKGVEEAGITKVVTSLIPEAEVFDAVEQNPKHLTVNNAGEVVRRLSPDIVVGIGGGSVLDAAKAIALLATNPGNIEDYEGKEQYKFPPLPVLAVPTTCGTGSEVTWVAVVTHTERRFKMSIKGPHMFPAAALVDPDLLATLPPRLVASTGMDALVHAVEAYTVKPRTILTNVLAQRAISLIFASLERAFLDIQGDTEARENIMLGSLVAGMAFGNSDVGAVHCISESVGALFDTPHGVANAMFLPWVMEFNLPVSAGRYAEIARLIGISEQDDIQAAHRLIQTIRDLSRKLGIPSLKLIGVPRDRFHEIAEKSFQNNSNPSNPREATAEDYRNILEAAYRAA